jgi:hypothetical protein
MDEILLLKILRMLSYILGKKKTDKYKQSLEKHRNKINVIDKLNLNL